MSANASVAIALLKGPQENLQVIQSASSDINKFIRNNIFCTEEVLSFDLNVSTATSAEFVARSEWYITGDVGLGYVCYQNNASKGLKFGDFQPYYGLNFNFLPVNRQRNYSLFSKNVYWPKLLSFVVGLTFAPQANASEGRVDLFKKASMVTALGLHISDQVRINPGVMWTKFTPSNPLTGTRNELSASFFISLSIDLDVYDWLRTTYSELFPKYTF